MTNRLTDDLIKRLETEVPTRELDGLIALELGWSHHFGGGEYVPDWETAGGHWVPPEYGDGHFSCHCENDAHFADPPPYTTDLNAARSLSNLVLLHAGEITADGMALVELGDTGSPVKTYKGIASRLEMAWCVAALKARQADDTV